jgi:hypothetical protein
MRARLIRLWLGNIEIWRKERRAATGRLPAAAFKIWLKSQAAIPAGPALQRLNIAVPRPRGVVAKPSKIAVQASHGLEGYFKIQMSQATARGEVAGLGPVQILNSLPPASTIHDQR